MVLFCGLMWKAFINQLGILSAKLYRLRLNDVTLSMSFLLVVLRDLSAWISIFCNAQLTELGSKTGYHRLTSLKMSKNFLIHHAGNEHSAHNFTLT